MTFPEELINAIIAYNDYRLHHEPYKDDPKSHLINELAKLKSMTGEEESLHTKLLAEHEAILAYNQAIDDKLKSYLDNVKELLKKLLVGHVVCRNSGEKEFVSDKMEYCYVTDVACNDSPFDSGIVAIGPTLEAKVNCYELSNSTLYGYGAKPEFFFDKNSFLKIMPLNGCIDRAIIKQELQYSRTRLTTLAEFDEVFNKMRGIVEKYLQTMRDGFMAFGKEEKKEG